MRGENILAIFNAVADGALQIDAAKKSLQQILIDEQLALKIHQINQQASLIVDTHQKTEGEQLEFLLCELLSSFLQQKKVEPKENMINLGMDSISATRFAELISGILGHRLSPTLFFEHGNLRSFAAFLMQRFPQEIRHFLQAGYLSSQQRVSGLFDSSPPVVEISPADNFDMLWERAGNTVTDSLDSRWTKQWCELPGAKIASYSCGEGVPFILLGGLGNKCSDWRFIGEQLSRQVRVTVIELPGHGESPDMVIEQMTFDALLLLVQQVIVNLGLTKPVILCGYSMGAMVVQGLLQNNLLEHVQGAILLAGVPVGVPVQDLFQKIAREIMEIKPSQRTAVPIHSLPPKTAEMYAAMFADVEVYPPNRATLFRGPVKIISGLTDCIADQHTTELLKTSFEQGELIALNNAGHLFPWTDADSLVEQLIRALCEMLDSDPVPFTDHCLKQSL